MGWWLTWWLFDTNLLLLSSFTLWSKTTTTTTDLNVVARPKIQTPHEENKIMILVVCWRNRKELKKHIQANTTCRCTQLTDAHSSDVLGKDIQLSPPVQNLDFQGSICLSMPHISSLIAACKPCTCGKCHNLWQYQILLSEKNLRHFHAPYVYSEK